MNRLRALCLALTLWALGWQAAWAQAPPAPFELQLPAPSGDRAIGVTEFRLEDSLRADPYVPDRRRELMVSVWYPAHAGRGAPAPYMKPGAARRMADILLKPLGVDPVRVDFAAIRTHASPDASADARGGPHPVILYSPGGNQPRSLGTALVEELASRGYVVVTIDHTHEANVIEFPEGRLVGNAVPRGEGAVQRMLAARVADVRFVLGQLEAMRRRGWTDADRRRPPRDLARAIDLSRVGVFGHSAGGHTALQAMRDDTRIDAAANLDGSLGFSMSRGVYSEVVERGLDRPFLLMGAGVTGPKRLPHHHAASPDWGRLWERSSGWKRDVYLEKAEHMSFGDHQALLPQLARQAKLPPLMATAVIGTIDPERSLAAQRAYLAAFFDLHLKGRPQPLFDGPSPQHPDVTLVE